MGRKPCCEKMGLKRGPWSHEEDQLLVSYIQQHGHPNWRALPKHAGLLRCGKSCRLRWINYLRPDIKRGNFTKEEEDTIFRLHEMLGNRWSLIAAKLPGRTDNEIKNVWHTHLKKRLENQETNTRVSRKRQTKSKLPASNAQCPEKTISSECLVHPEDSFVDEEQVVSNQPSSSESSSITEETTESPSVTKHEEINHETLLDDSFWLETLSGEGNNMEFNPTTSIPGVEFPTSPLKMIESVDTRTPTTSCDMLGMDPWYDLFMRIEELPELPEF